MSSDRSDAARPAGDSPAAGPPPRDGRRRDGAQGLFERIFPGPTPTDPKVAARLAALARAAERRDARDRQHPSGDHPRPAAPGPGAAGAPSRTPAAAAEAMATLVEAIHEQTEVLQALLDADVAIRDDARATA